jgi:hypothetical protein
MVFAISTARLSWLALGVATVLFAILRAAGVGH